MSGGTKVYCPYCEEFSFCQAVALEDGVGSQQRYRINHKDLQFFTRHRKCLKCYGTFYTNEIEEGYIDELVAHREWKRNYLKNKNKKKVLSVRNKNTWLKPELPISLSLIIGFIEASVEGLSDESSFFDLHISDVYQSLHGHGWVIRFGEDVFLIEVALQGIKEIVNNSLKTIEEGDLIHQSDFVYDLKKIITKAIANEKGYRLVESYPNDNYYMEFQGRRINLEAASQFILNMLDMDEFLLDDDQYRELAIPWE